MFEVVIVSSVFEGKRLLARHKIVNEALKEEISKVHAFTQVRFILISLFTHQLIFLLLFRNHSHLRNGKRRRPSKLYND
jgi:hypothetical protein